MDPSRLPDLASLALFVSVVELGSLTQAAEARGISQPSASARLRRLERSCGVQLLVRSARGSSPTRDGALVAAWAADALRAGHRFDQSVASLRDRDAGRLRVASSQTNAEHVLPRALGRVRQAIALELAVGNSGWVVQALRDGRADLGFIESPSVPPGFGSSIVAHDLVVVVVAPGHPWARRRRAVDLAELAATPLITREQGSGTREAFERAIHTHGLHLAPPRMELGSNAAVRAALLDSDAPGVLSRLAVEGELADGTLRTIDVDGFEVQRDLRALWPRDRAPTGPAAALLRSLQVDQPR